MLLSYLLLYLQFSKGALIQCLAVHLALPNVIPVAYSAVVPYLLHLHHQFQAPIHPSYHPHHLRYSQDHQDTKAFLVFQDA